MSCVFIVKSFESVSIVSRLLSSERENFASNCTNLVNDVTNL